MKVKLALLQSRDYGSGPANLKQTLRLIDEAAAKGANVICTQELFMGDYFCRTQDPELLKRAEAIPGPTTSALMEAAKKHGVVIVGSLFEEAMPGLTYNTSVVIDADGSFLGKYRKNHIPQDPYFEEKFYFAPGDLGFPVWNTRFGRLGVIICWDQWYPESARAVALSGAEIILVPTAIGWIPGEEDQHARQHAAWETVQRGHAVANGVWYAAVNRVGTEAPITFWGRSFVADECGEIVAKASTDKEEVLLAELDLTALRARRGMWPFFRDRRIDAYAPLLKRGGL